MTLRQFYKKYYEMWWHKTRHLKANLSWYEINKLIDEAKKEHSGKEKP